MLTLRPGLLKWPRHDPAPNCGRAGAESHKRRERQNPPRLPLQDCALVVQDPRGACRSVDLFVFIVRLRFAVAQSRIVVRHRVTPPMTKLPTNFAVWECCRVNISVNHTAFKGTD